MSVDKQVPEVHVGDYFYEDGTWSTNYKKGHGAVVGLVFSTETSAADKAAGYPHGYVVALTNVDNVAWSTSTVSTGMDVLPLNSDDNTWINAIAGELDGLSHTNYIKENYASTYTSAFPAFNAALNYTPVASKTTYDNSGWYLPSIGQLYLLTYNFCNQVTTWPNADLRRWSTTGEESIGYLNQTATRNALNSYFSQRLDTDITNAGGSAVSYSDWKLFGSGPSHNYWSSTEYNDSYAYYYHYGGSNTIIFMARHSSWTKTYTSGVYFHVRPVLAF